MIHDSILYDLIQGQGQGHGSPKVAKITNFKVCFFHWHPCNQKINSGLQSSKTVSEFLCRHSFWYSSSFGVTWPSNWGCCKESIDSPVRGLFIYLSMTCRVVDHFCCEKEWTEQFVVLVMSRACVSYSGQVPARAEYNYLDRVRWLDMYGVVLHPVKVPHSSQH